MRKHVADPKRSPLLIFPEGTCVNNEYTVLFHKGAFDLPDTAVCPVAIKYDKRYADAYWHSRAQTFTQHILYLMTRWALVADVWFLPPQTLRKGTTTTTTTTTTPNPSPSVSISGDTSREKVVLEDFPRETAAEFANRVKAMISDRANLKNLSWDGYFKNYAPPKDKQERLKENPQSRYGAVLLHRMRNGVYLDNNNNGNKNNNKNKNGLGTPGAHHGGAGGGASANGDASSPNRLDNASFRRLRRSVSICLGDATSTYSALRYAPPPNPIEQPDWLSTSTSSFHPNSNSPNGTNGTEGTEGTE
ncbi:hypothetical protein HK102_010609, partial [Quaeritorhiza haematococci]